MTKVKQVVWLTVREEVEREENRRVRPSKGKFWHRLATHTLIPINRTAIKAVFAQWEGKK